MNSERLVYDELSGAFKNVLLPQRDSHLYCPDEHRVFATHPTVAVIEIDVDTIIAVQLDLEFVARHVFNT